MLTLYFSKGSSALAAHIMLEETCVPYGVVQVSIPDDGHKTVDFLELSPKGRVPVLQTAQGVITENPAILEYIATAHLSAGLLPQSKFEQAQARSFCAYLCATVHVAYAHQSRGARWADEAETIAGMRKKVGENLKGCAAYLDAHLLLSPWALGAQYSFCDPYLFLMGQWMAKCDLTLAAYPKLAAHDAAMRARPATQAALAAHDLV